LEGEGIVTLEPVGAAGMAGTAWHIGEGLFVTVFHCVSEGGRPVEGDAFRLVAPGGLELGRARISEHAPALDLAILRLPGGAGRLAAIPVAAPPRSGPTPGTVGWKSLGFPSLRVDGLTLNGTVTSYALPDRDAGQVLQLSCEQGGHGFLDGASGAPVIVNGYAVGVLRGSPQASLDDILLAVRLDTGATALKALATRLASVSATVLGPGRREALWCDRTAQWEEVREFLDGSVHQPRVMLLHGHEDEAHAYFTARLGELARRRRTGEAPNTPPLRVIDLPSAPPQRDLSELEGQLVERLCPGQPGALWEELGQLVRRERLVLLFEKVVARPARLELMRRFYAEVIPALLTRLRGKDEAPWNPPLVLQPLSWEAPGWAVLRRLRLDPGRPSSFLKALRESRLAVPLPELTRIAREDVETFLSRFDLPPAEANRILENALRGESSEEILEALDGENLRPRGEENP
jgi:hypothetical protein